MAAEQQAGAREANSVLGAAKAKDSRVQDAEALYRAGRTAEVLDFIEDAWLTGIDYDTVSSLLVLRGMSLFDTGNVIDSLQALHNAVDQSRHLSLARQFEVAFALFVRECDFQAPNQSLPCIAQLRQLASSVGDAPSLCGLHLAVARLEGLRGNCVNAHRHLEIAHGLAARIGEASTLCSIDLVDASLESTGGNLARSRRLSEACWQRAENAGYVKYKAGSATNLAVVALHGGQFERARAHLRFALDATSGLTYVRLAASDTLALLELEQGNKGRCAELLAECDALIAADRVPATSWYEFDCARTRCAYLERLEDWPRIIEIVNGVDDELARRQYKVLRTTLICAKARALARLDRHADADLALAIAVRTCPRGAVDPQIVLEASKAACASLRGEAVTGATHFDRALSACRAIGHRYHESWIDRQRAAVAARTPTAAPAVRRAPDTAAAGLILSDVATLLGAGHSIDLLAHRVTMVLESTSVGPRVHVHAESGHEYLAEPVVTWSTDAAGACRLELGGSDRRVSIEIRDAQSLDDISILKNVADIVQAAVSRTQADPEDEDQNLWPKAVADESDAAVFRSPRMAELVRVAARLASTDLPILISGETGTGKEVMARLVHDHSLVKRGPFVAFNCTTLPRDLVESQLFGHRRGAFTGAVDSFAGVIRTAERGTLFLDEVGDLDLGVQPKLLRFLENAEVQPVGEARAQRVTVRIVAATNADVDDMVQQGRFRRDLYYRMCVARLSLPPLRERKDEIPALAALFLTRWSRECQRAGLRLGDDLIAALLLYDWPGNIRQLANEMRRVVAMASNGDTLSSRDLAPEVTRAWDTRAPASADSGGPALTVRLDQTLAEAVSELESAFIERALQTAGGRVAEAAQLLGLSRKGLFLKRRRRGLVEATTS